MDPRDDVPRLALARAVPCRSAPRDHRRRWKAPPAPVSRGWLVAAFALAVGVVAQRVPQVLSCHGESKAEAARWTAQRFAGEAMALWASRQPPDACPTSLAELTPYMNSDSIADPWGDPYLMGCAYGHLVVVSVGEDGHLGTPDDVRSDR